MDWIEEFLEKCKRTLKNSSLRKTLALYMVAAVMLTFAMVILTWLVCDSWKNVICQVNGINEDYRYIGSGDFVIYESDGSVTVSGEEGSLILPAEDVNHLSKKDSLLYECLNLLQVLSIPVYSMIAIILVSFAFYRNKLREPIFLMKKEMEAIRRGDMQFSCRYDSADEMGDICRSMDSMRCAVVDNMENMYELMEEQRKINAAFAHDIRTPLTVIDGYVEMLQEYYPKGKISEQQLLDMLDSMKGQSQRMRVFSETMKKVQNFEALEIKKVKHNGEELKAEICNMARGMEEAGKISIEVKMEFSNPELYYDENVVMEVLGNLLSNAMRYGKQKIEITAEQQEDKLFVYVKDDGRGMTKEELYKADSPYYSDKTKEEADGHFGLGLTICKILCKKHGGGISLFNSIEGGAIVCAEFFVG
ncbi:MAG: ATP-binding protein [Lachnospiraceae bacterium]